jgi:inorganic triphosphatase YgiF
VSGHPVESELKFRATDDEPLLALAGAPRLGPALLGPPRTVAELDRYLDTPGRRLAAARWACRLRSRGGETIVSLKGPAQHLPGDAVHRRPEVEGPAIDDLDPSRWPPSPARRLLRELGAEGPLAERLALVQERTEREVRVDDAVAGTLSLDRCTVVREGDPRGELLVVELEMTPAGLEAADALAEALGGVPGLRPEPESKLTLALALLGEPRE